MDTLTPEQRSERMSRVKQADTKPEVLFRRALHRLGLRYTLHDRNLPGTPDVIFPKYNVAVFVHGCFWHRHTNCKKSATPKTNASFWETKFNANVERDSRKIRDLELKGWRVFVVWQCELSTRQAVTDTATRFYELIKGDLSK